LARVSEEEGLALLAQDEVVVACARSVGREDAQFSRHTEVDAKPGAAGKAKEHLFAVGARFQKFGAGESGRRRGQGNAAKNAFAAELDGEDFLAKAVVPLLSKVFDFRQFRHEERLPLKGRDVCAIIWEVSEKMPAHTPATAL